MAKTKSPPRTLQKPNPDSDSDDDAVASNTPLFGVAPTPTKAESKNTTQTSADPTLSPGGDPDSSLTPESPPKIGPQSPPSTPPAPEPLPATSPDRPPRIDTGFSGPENSQPPPLPFSTIGAVKSLMAGASAGTSSKQVVAKAADVRQLMLSDSNLLDLEGLELSRFTSLQLANFSFNNISTVTPLMNLNSSLTNLTVLDVSHNKLTHLDGIQTLHQLQVIRAHSNKIDDLSCLAESHFPVLTQLWLHSNAIEAQHLFHLSAGFDKMGHALFHANPCCSHLNYKEILLSSFPSLSTFDGKVVSEEELEEAAAFYESTDGRTTFHKLKFDLIQASKLVYNKTKIAMKESGGGENSPSIAMARNGSLARLRRVKKAREAAMEAQINDVKAQSVVGGSKSVRMNLKAKAKSKSPIRRRAPGATTSAISPPRMSEADMATVSISDCLSMLPSFDKKTEELNAASTYIAPRPRGLKPKKLKVRTTVKFAPVNWVAQMDTTCPRDLSPRTPLSARSSSGHNHENTAQDVTSQTSITPPQKRSPKCLPPPITLKYPSGTLALQSRSSTAIFKWPSGGQAISRLEDRITASYPNGSMACTFDSNSNGNVSWPDGSTALSFSTASCLYFEKKGKKVDVKTITTSSAPVKIALSKEIGIKFHPNPLRIQVYVKVKNCHFIFYAPNLKNGSVVEVLEGKGDVFGETEKKVVKKKKEVPLEHVDFLSAISAAVAGL
ncbi:hypothetical protein TL16_g07686 [Triparma laevis f. inornata]|uniref:Uncharacterized protein n=1 Tax=Triparma laevis f. inornata TaxID=1714386 RepID=A0A9W7B1B3_9STRA|nr:hypothetical protein TL16_g07686 [Triparma laevis f. inornata]